VKGGVENGLERVRTPICAILDAADRLRQPCLRSADIGGYLTSDGAFQASGAG
jgi:hypothetical protein